MTAAPAAPQQEAAPPQGLVDRLFPYVRMFLMWYAFQKFMGSMTPEAPTQSTIAPPTPALNTPHMAEIDTQQDAGHQVVSRQPLVYRNAFAPGDAMSLRVYVSPESTFSFASMDAATEQEQLRWQIGASELMYSTVGNTAREDLQWTQDINITVDDYLLRNGSMYAHVFLTKDGFSPNPEDSEYAPTATVHRVVPLTAYRPRPKTTKKRNLLAKSDQEDVELVSTSVDTSVDANTHSVDTNSNAVDTNSLVDETYISMWRPSVTLNVVFDNTEYSSAKRPPPFLLSHMSFDKDTATYAPVLYHNEFWQLEEHLMPVNATLATLPLAIAFYPLPVYKFALYTQMEQNFKNQEAAGATTRRDTDNMKRMFLETNPYLLAVTMIVSLLHSLFDFLAFKNDVSFWKNQKSLAGLSLRTIALNTFFQLVIFLYLMDNDTSWMVLASQFVSLLINAWKIKKAVVFSRDTTTNKLTVTGVESYTDSPTAEHDRVAVAHLSFVLYPLIVGHACYSLTYGVHKGWYSWVISSLTSFVYAFGFIMMTPQLYINYKLKSVAHLPWRAMVYKSLNTFIDDLFAFVIKMPWMHRLSCFRDDLIFFIYLYQRWIYPVDAKRTNEFGQGGEDAVDDDAALLVQQQAVQDRNDQHQETDSSPTVTTTTPTGPIPSTEYLVTRRTTSAKFQKQPKKEL